MVNKRILGNDAQFKRFSEDERSVIDAYTDFMIKNYSMKDKAEYLPDTFVCDALFLTAFITDEMLAVLPAYINNYFKIHKNHIDSFQYQEYADTNPTSSNIRISIYRKCLNIIYCGTKEGDADAKIFFIDLYKKYYKKEYLQLKRFKKLTLDDILCLCVVGDEISFEKMARTLCMSNVLGIRVSKESEFLYGLISKKITDDSQSINPVINDEESFDENYQEIKGYLELVKGANSIENVLSVWETNNRIIENAFELAGFPKDTFFKLNNQYTSSQIELTKALILFRRIWPDADIDFSKIQNIASINTCVEKYIDMVNTVSDELDKMLGIDNSYNEYIAEIGVRFNNCDKAKEVAKLTPEFSKNEILLDEKEIELVKQEVKMLQKKNHQLQNDCKAVHQLLLDTRKELQEVRTEKNSLENDRAELFALREFVYSITESDISISEVPIKEIENRVASFHIAIVGGFEGWVKKIQERFPNWLYLSPKISGTLDTKAIFNVDKVYFFTECLSHSTYLKLIRIIRDNNVPFGYVNTVNIERFILQVYNEWKSEC